MNDTHDSEHVTEIVLFVPGLFPLGHIVATPGVADTLDPADVAGALGRHAAGDWGDVDEHDWEANANAVEHGGRILSVYHADTNGERFWVITEADRLTTTVLFPSEY
ncbi:MAG: hypothetical protein U0871_15415 [Gemmataceae bacterium]